MAPDSGEVVAPASFPPGGGGARPALRLVGAEGTVHRAASEAALAARRRAVERENHASSALDGADAREIVAARAAEALEGGRAAVLRPESRRRVVALATRLGLRPFDANLIIAIVQDGARRGVHPGDPGTHAMLRLIEGPRGRRAGGARAAAAARCLPLARTIAAALLGVLWGAALAAWVVGLF